MIVAQTVQSFLAVLQPFTDWIVGGVAVLASVVLAWNILSTWLRDPERMTIHGTLVQVLSVGLMAYVVLNSQRMLQWLVSVTRPNQLTPIAVYIGQAQGWLTAGAIWVGGFVAVWLIFQRWVSTHRHDRAGWYEVLMQVYTVFVITMTAHYVGSLILWFTTTTHPLDAQGWLGGVPTFQAMLAPVITWTVQGLSLIAAILTVYSIYQEWADDGLNIDLREVLFKITGIILVGALAIRAPAVLQSLSGANPAIQSGGLWNTLPDQARMMQPAFEWVVRGAGVLGALVVVIHAMEQWHRERHMAITALLVRMSLFFCSVALIVIARPLMTALIR